MTNEKSMKRVLIDTNIFMSVVHREDFLLALEEMGYSDVCTVIEVLMELDNLKTKEGKSGYEARKAIKLIKWMLDEEELTVVRKSKEEIADMFANNTEKKMGFADEVMLEIASKHDTDILSNDISMGLLGEALGINVETYKQSDNTFILDSSITEIHFEDMVKEEGYESLDMEGFLSGDFISLNEGEFSAGDYIILRYSGGKNEIFIIKESPLTKQQKLEKVYRKDINFNSTMFGVVTPKRGDLYQECLFDSLNRNQISLITGPPGTGKTFLSMAAIFNKIETSDFDKLVIFTNPEDTKGGAKLGYYKGDLISKLLQKSVGSVLESKLGGIDGVMRLISDGTLVLKSVNDIRGYELPPKSILYITEAQNMNIELMKLAIQRVPSDAKVIIEGDPETQLDNYIYEGHNNGMLKLLEVFTGTGIFGHVDLKTIYRSNIASIAERMTE